MQLEPIESCKLLNGREISDSDCGYRSLTVTAVADASGGPNAQVNDSKAFATLL
jgi:hypothetical protein